MKSITLCKQTIYGYYALGWSFMTLFCLKKMCQLCTVFFDALDSTRKWVKTYNTEDKMEQKKELHQVWQQCLDLIQEAIGEKNFQTWFLPIVPLALENNVLTLLLPTHYFCDYVEQHFQEAMGYALRTVISPNVRLVYEINIDSTSPEPNRTTLTTSSEGLGEGSNKFVDQQSKNTSHFDSQLNPKFTFDNFYRSECNHVARSIAESIVSNPINSPISPFFIYGASGVGKTHLCHAIGWAIKEHYPKLNVLYVSSHLFQLQYTTASQNKSINDFINFYQRIDVLIIDDIQFFMGKVGTQKAFFQIFNHLYMLHKQIILTSDKPPVDLNGMEERLFSRISGAITVELQRPDLSLRKEILQQKAKESGSQLPAEIIDFIAEHATHNVRELEGAFLSLVAHAAFAGCDITLAFAKKILKRSVLLEKKEVSIPDIEKVVCSDMSLHVQEVRSKSRKQKVVEARHLIMYFSKKYTDYSLSAIGEFMGGRTHATVLHGCKMVKDQMGVNPQFNERVMLLEKQIR